MTSLRETNLVYDTARGEYPLHGTWLSVDVIALTDDDDGARVALIKREAEPHKGETTLPGGLLAAWNGETIEDAARRILNEKAGLVSENGIAIVNVVSDSKRDERGHTVSVVVATVVSGKNIPYGVPGAVLPADIPETMPFKHSDMVKSALHTLRNRLFVDEETTYKLFGSIVTSPKASGVLTSCGMSKSAARSKLERSPLYRPMEHEYSPASEGGGRPSRLFARV